MSSPGRGSGQGDPARPGGSGHRLPGRPQERTAGGGDPGRAVAPHRREPLPGGRAGTAGAGGEQIRVRAGAARGHTPRAAAPEGMTPAAGGRPGRSEHPMSARKRLHRPRHHRPRGSRAGAQAARHVHRRDRRRRAPPPGLGNPRQQRGRGDERPRQPDRGDAAPRRFGEHPGQRPRDPGGCPSAFGEAGHRSHPHHPPRRREVSTAAPTTPPAASTESGPRW